MGVCMKMKIIDFDAKFMEYARKWMLAHADLTDDQVEESYNQMMQEWVSAPADWLDGASPENYFRQVESADALIELMLAYSRAKINLPEPLYSLIVERGEECAEPLCAILMDATQKEELRAEVMAMLRDMDVQIADQYMEELVCGATEENELSELAVGILSTRDASVATRLLDRYDGCSDYAKSLILDVCSNFPGDERIYQHLLNQLRNDPERRALWAACLGKLGDERAIEPLKEMLGLFDLRYMDYIELRDAVEKLGGDAGEERAFYGDPDFELLRNL